MKLSTCLIAISSAIASVHATESCSIQALFLFASPNSIECTFETGYASVLLTIPTGNQLKKVCGNDACQRFFGQLNTAFPRECDFFGKPFRESFLDKIAVACAPPTTAPPATTKPAPVPTTTVPVTPKPTPSSTTAVPSVTSPEPVPTKPTPEPTTTAPATTTPVPETTNPVPAWTTMGPIPTTPGPEPTPEPTAEPTVEPTVEPTAEPTPEPIPEPTPQPTPDLTTPPTMVTKPPYPTSTKPSVPSPSPPTGSPSPTTKPPPPSRTPSPTAPDSSATCSLIAPAKCSRKFINVDIYDNDITSFFYVKDSNDCCELCANTAGCKAYSYSKWDTRCYVKDIISGFTMNTNFVSGLIN